MKAKKLIESYLHSGHSSRTSGIIALVAGLAAGAVLGILFAPDSGAEARKKLCDAASGLFGGHDEEEQPQEEEANPHSRGEVKRPKSDIKALVHDAHMNAGHSS